MSGRWAVALRMFVVLSILTGLIYPLAVTGIAQLTMSADANGSLVRDAQGRVVGSSLIGQAVTGDGWFHGRPDAYDPTATGGSNLGPSNPQLGKLSSAAAAAVRALNDLPPQQTIPVDAVTTSFSGLDPDISPAYAQLQAARVAEARGLTRSAVLSLIARHTSGRTFGFLGEPRVDVLLLNLALERLASSS